MTRSKRRVRIIALAAAVFALALAGFAALAEGVDDVALYGENQWNYVDDSMDVSAGIPENAEGVLGRVRETGVLRVATEPYFPPQEFIDPSLEGQDSYVGADMEMARLIAQRMGVALEIVPMEFSETLNAVADGNCDLAISALMYTPGRAARMTLSKGYNFSGENAGSGLMIRTVDRRTITGIESLENRDIVAQSGSLQESLMADNVHNYREFRRVPTMQDVYRALANGSADAAMVDIESGAAYVENNPEMGLMLVSGVRFTPEAQYDGDRVAARKGENQLIAFVNGVIDELLESGQYRDWMEQYAALAEALDM